MSNLLMPISRIKHDEDGATILEFAVIAPVFLFLLLGTFDIGYAIYMRSALNGAIQTAARSATLQDASVQENRDAIDAEVREILKMVNGAVTDDDIDIERKSYVSFGDVERLEDYEDDNGNGTCDNGEEFFDENSNDEWDNVGQDGNGGARDSVLYTVTVSYDAVFPFETFRRDAKNPDAAFTLNGLTNRRVLSATTLLKNQPFGDQTARTAEDEDYCVDD